MEVLSYVPPLTSKTLQAAGTLIISGHANDYCGEVEERAIPVAALLDPKPFAKKIRNARIDAAVKKMAAETGLSVNEIDSDLTDRMLDE